MTTGKGTWIPESQRDHRWYIWHKKFLCRIPNIHTMSIDYIKNFGMPTCGDNQFDRETANELKTMMLTINDMMDLFGKGVTIAVVNIRDTKEIYERITDHLVAWKQHLENGWHVKNAPIDDLLQMDKFAGVVYKYAQPQFTTQTVESILARRMSSTFRVGRDRIMGGLSPKVTVINGDGEKEEKKPERESFADSLLNRKATAAGASKWR